MSRQHLTAAQFRRMPWKNGGGTTTELVMRPAQGDLENDFVWRASLAEISASGPFSTFAGFDRHIMQLEGLPMQLTQQKGPAGETLELDLNLFHPYLFPGEWNTSGNVQTGGALDFNLMVNRAKAQGKLSSYCLAPGTEQSFCAADVWFAYVWEGVCEIRAEQKGKLVSSRLPARRALLIEHEAGLSISASSPHISSEPLVLLLVELSLHSPPSPAP